MSVIEMLILSLVALIAALVPALLFCVNLRAYAPPPALPIQPVGAEALPHISVLIPARDEEWSIAAAVRSVLASVGVDLEIVVMDDASTDHTAAIVQKLALEDLRVRLEHAPPLPAGWNGKQHACWALAHCARNPGLHFQDPSLGSQRPILCFMDADVRLQPQALARMAGFLSTSGSELVSGFPLQQTETFLEWLLLPLIHFVLLGFLPVSRMRAGTDPAFAAGCGQFLMVDRDAYMASGGHAEIKATMHDGLLLPRLLRQHRFRTDIADITDLATCRMYRNAGEVWRGLAKNATEGLAAPARIVPVTLILLAGQVLPFVLTAIIAARRGQVSFGEAPFLAKAFTLLAVMAAWLPRILGVMRFRQAAKSALLHPLGILLLLVLQWYALLRRITGKTATWKQRAYSSN